MCVDRGVPVSDVGGKPIARPTRRALEVGDRVVITSVADDADAYDVGTIVGFTFNGARVHWERADEVYTERLEDLRRAGVP